MPRSLSSILDASRAFADLEPEVLEALLYHAKSLELASGDCLFHSGDDYKNAIFIPVDGELELRWPNGQVAAVNPNDILGLTNYLDETAYHSSLVARTRASVVAIPKQIVHALELRYPSLGNALSRIIAEKLRAGTRSATRLSPESVLAKPVYTMMRSPVRTCAAHDSLSKTLELMHDSRIGSLVVTDPDQRLLGIVTYKSLAAALLKKGLGPDTAVLEAVSANLQTISPEAPLWEAEERQKAHRAKYLVVVEGEHPVGMVSQTDILTALVSHQAGLVTAIKGANSIKALRRLYHRLPDLAAEALETHRSAAAAARLLSETHLALQRRCVELSLLQLPKKAPIPFALIIMGSGGRKEMLLNPDQDNGLILADGPDSKKKKVQDWFQTFTDNVSESLDRIGYILCPGEIMARNPMYRKTVKQWRKQISYITRYPSSKAAKWSNIIFDFDTLYGDDSLTVQLRRYAAAQTQRHRALLRGMAEHDAEGRPALGLFNRLVATTNQGKRRGTIDIKRNGLRIIADAARVFALDEGITACNTVDRLQALVRLGKFDAEYVASVTAAHDVLFDIALTHQIKQARAGKELDKFVYPHSLSAKEREALRIAMVVLKGLQNRLQRHFDLSVF